MYLRCTYFYISVGLTQYAIWRVHISAVTKDYYQMWWERITLWGGILVRTVTVRSHVQNFVKPYPEQAPDRRQAIIYTNGDPVQWRIYAALGDMS